MTAAKAQEGAERLVEEAQGLRLAPVLFAAYPRESATVVLLLVLAGLAEGLGVASILPLLQSLAGGSASEATPLDDMVRRVFATFGLEPTLGATLVVVVVGMALKAGLTLIAMSQVGLAMARIGHRLRLTLLRALLQAKWSYFTRQPVGALANAVNNETSGAAGAFFSVAHVVAAT